MTLELALKLREAGFPKHYDEFVEYSRPTLSELIESCGHVSLDYFPDGNSFASCCDRKGHEVIGKTPEEAVAKLWLALNERKEK